ncbi:unnamed protein product [Rotaria magnacalcarata]|nr:unnamed protein product [Rotaria magnacalcarata]CAF1661766.1 unnamed protein product [Rotaria magnacalcarata]CAF2049066.1 unnamed protein product [Rotaria magnacalcarata]CAF2110484.1 unnamed protein product [Rotaria magnacalcarata]CAF3945929.1 unnamed protein product [Rotaria magnacalcarata]
MVDAIRSTAILDMSAGNVLTASSDKHKVSRQYYLQKIEELQLNIAEKSKNLCYLQAKRNELNAKKGKFVIDLGKYIDITKVTLSCHVALENDSYTLHKILPNKIDPLISFMIVESVLDSTYEMIDGLDKQIKAIKEIIELPVKYSELFDALGISQPKGVLLYGPSDTGKTLLARAVAYPTECTFICVSGSKLVQRYIGEGSRMVRELFVVACERAPSIILMDEIDSIGSTRVESSLGGDSEVQRTMLELLNQ